MKLNGVPAVVELWLVTALLSAFFLASANVTARLSYNRHGGFWEVFYVGGVIDLLLAVPVLIVSFAFYGVPSGREFLISLLFGLASATFPSVLFGHSIRECGAVITGSSSLSVEPLTATLLGAIIVGEQVGWNLVVAVALFPVIAYLLYRGGKHAKAFEDCGLKTFIGAFIGAWASVMGVIFAYLVSKGLATNPVLFYVSGLIVKVVVFLPVAWRKNIGLSVFGEVPKVLYLSSFLATLGVVSKMVSLSYGVPGHTISVILLYPAITVPLSHVIKETAEPINRYTVMAVVLATISGFLVGSG